MDKPKSMGEYLEMTDAQKMQAAGLCSPAPDGSPDDFRKVRECIGLLDSMVRCGEDHDDDTERRVADALKIVVRIEANIGICLKNPPNPLETNKPESADKDGKG